MSALGNPKVPESQSIKIHVLKKNQSSSLKYNLLMLVI